MTNHFVLRGGTVIDETGRRAADVEIRDGVVAAVGELSDVAGANVVDAAGCIVAPGLVDIHVHLREPGREEAETIESGTRAAALGGVTAIVAMPNTEPCTDTVGVVRQVQQRAIGAMAEVIPAAAMTMGRKGKQLTAMAELHRAGVRMFTDDGDGLQDAGMMRHALEYSKMLGVVLSQHCEVASLSGGAMHEGDVSTILGVKGIPPEAEEFMVARDIALARKTGGRVHLQHLSTARSVAMLRAAKADRVDVTAEVAPHHFTLTDEALRTFDANFKVHPPLRSQDHVDAIKAAIQDGVIDAIATDHAPHQPHVKEYPLDKAAAGMLGLETSLALALTELDVPIKLVLAMMSWQPARIAQIEHHGLPVAVGNAANLCVIDPEANWVVDPAKLASLSRNTPFAGRKLRGKVRHTFLYGEAVVLEGEAQR